MAEWPDRARAALCLSFDNLGEAAELELGAFPADAPLGEHFTVTRVLPQLLAALNDRDIAATFFVEGLNAELYPEALAAIAAAGHETAYHAWRHEQWDALPAAAQAANLARGVAAFRSLDLDLVGMRPPGGGLGPGGVEAIRRAGLRYCSPAGAGASDGDGVALLPFQWHHVDAACVLPPLGPVRERIAGSADPLDPGAFLAFLEAELDSLSREGGFAAIVLHLAMLDWLGEDRLATLLDCLGAAARNDGVWLAPCARVADHILAEPELFPVGTKLDPLSWSG
jgi:peptidoglycan/xylan/chitin deacetylase (PgdA/CDA1 family)